MAEILFSNFASLLVSIVGSVIAHYLIKRLERLSNCP